MTRERAACPECGGPWLHRFTFRHLPNGCAIGMAEQATQYADYRRFEVLGRPALRRKSTAAELALAEVFRGGPTEDPDPVTIVIRDAVGVHYRIVAGVDPEGRLESLQDGAPSPGVGEAADV